jgi:hypothetical protein
MAQILQVSTTDLIHMATWPFPPERGAIYDPTMLAHGLELHLGPDVFVVPVDAAVEQQSAKASLTRSQWAAFVTSTTIQRVLSQQQLASRLEPAAAEAVLATNRADLEAFTIGLLKSPPACEPLPGQQTTVVITGTIVIVIPIPVRPEPNPLTGEVEALTRPDLLGVGVRLRAAAESPDAGTLKDAFVAAADRMFEAAERG